MEHYQPPFSITNQMLMLVAEISEKIGRISSYHEFETKPHLRRNNRIRSIHSSLAIEANSLSLDEVKSVVSGKIAVGFSPEAVGSKIFAHGNGLLSLSDGREMSRKHYFLATIIPPVFQMLLAGTMPRTQEVG